MFLVAVDIDSGAVYVTGSISGSIDDQPFVGSSGLDAVLLKYDMSGIWQWTRMRGTTGVDRGYGG